MVGPLEVNIGSSVIVELHPKFAECCDGYRELVGEFFVLGHAAVALEHHGNLEFGWIRLAWLGQVELPAPCIETTRASNDVKTEREIRCVSSERPTDANVEFDRAARIAMAMCRHKTKGGLVAKDAAIMRRVADRCTDIATEFEGGETSRQRGRRSARRSTRSHLVIPRVPRRAVDRVERLPIGHRHRDAGCGDAICRLGPAACVFDLGANHRVY